VTRVYIPTTRHPVEIISLIEESADIESVICLAGSFEGLPVSAAYHAFVRRPTGLIEKLTGVASFRTDVSGTIDQGNSWQLPMLLAHRLHHKKRFRQSDAKHMIWATGQVDINQNVTPVQHIREKLAASQTLFDDLMGKGITVHLVMHPDNMVECEDLKSKGFICHAVRGVIEIDRLLIDAAFAAPSDPVVHKSALSPWQKVLRQGVSWCWRRRQIMGYGLIALMVFGLYQQTPWKPIHEAMMLEKQGRLVELIRVLKTYRQNPDVMSRISFRLFEEMALKRKSDRLIRNLEVHLVWAVPGDGLGSCDNSDMRWHKHLVDGETLPSLPSNLCRLYLDIRNIGSTRQAVAVAVRQNPNENHGENVLLMQPTQSALAPTENMRSMPIAASSQPMVIMLATSDHMDNAWYPWFERWVNRPTISFSQRLHDTGIGARMASQDMP